MFHIAKPLTATLLLSGLAAPSFAAPVLIADARARFEMVESEAFSQKAQAATMRLRLGAEFALTNKFTALIEASHTRPLGAQDYNSTVNGKGAFPVIADPKSTRLNRLQLSFSPLDGIHATVGRQRLILQDARFIGNVGFRQQEQTFDAVKLTANMVENVALTYVYLAQANRIFGSKSSMGSHDLNGHVIEASYKTGIGLAVTGFFHDIENEDAAVLSLKTYGGRVNGTIAVSDGLKLLVDGAYASQRDTGNNSMNRSHDFSRLVLGATQNGFVIKGGFEQLTGNGTTAFATPLATGHKFQGFADMFLGTPPMGLKDRFLTLAYKGDALHGVKPMVTYHDFKSETGGMEYGSELDVVLTYKATGQITLQAKYANYQSDGFGVDTQKLWLAVTFKP